VSFHSTVGRETQEIHIVPNDDGTKSTLSIILSGDELKVSSPAPSAGVKSELGREPINEHQLQSPAMSGFGLNPAFPFRLRDVSNTPKPEICPNAKS
jgi:hypothetical protein